MGHSPCLMAAPQCVLPAGPRCRVGRALRGCAPSRAGGKEGDSTLGEADMAAVLEKLRQAEQEAAALRATLGQQAGSSGGETAGKPVDLSRLKPAPLATGAHKQTNRHTAGLQLCGHMR
jgi:hypothetical protein